MKKILPGVVRFAVNLVFFSITSGFFTEFQSAQATLQTARVPGLSAYFHQVPVHNTAFTTSTLLPVCLENIQRYIINCIDDFKRLSLRIVSSTSDLVLQYRARQRDNFLETTTAAKMVTTLRNRGGENAFIQ